jgi:tight adherence protein B
MSAVIAAVAAGLAVAGLWPARPSPGPVSRSAGVGIAVLVTALAVGSVPAARVEDLAGAWVWPGLIGAAALLGGAVIARHARARRVVAARSSRVFELCEELAGDLTAGAMPGSALRRAAERWAEVAPVAAAHDLGGSVPAAWRQLAARPGAGDLVVVGAAWEVAERTGAGLAEALTEVAVGIRDQQRTRRVVASELASARATARLMAVLPVLTLAVGAGAGDPVGFLLGTPVGLACAALGLVLSLAGVAWIEAIASSLARDAAWSPR